MIGTVSKQELLERQSIIAAHQKRVEENLRAAGIEPGARRPEIHHTKKGGSNGVLDERHCV